MTERRVSRYREDVSVGEILTLGDDAMVEAYECVAENASIVPMGLIRNSHAYPAINRRAILEASLAGRRRANLSGPEGHSRIARQFTGGNGDNDADESRRDD
jgi:hypothetical protein